MAFWDAPIRAVQSFFGGFGGNNNQKKKPDDQPQNQITGSFTSAPKFNNPANPSNPLQVQQPKNQFQTGATALTLPGSNQSKSPIPGLNLNNPTTPPVVQKTPQQTELDQLTQKNLPSAMKQTQQGENWFDKGVNFFTNDDQKIAQQNARNRAVSQYQEAHGYNQDPEVMKFIGNTRDLGNRTSQEIQQRSQNLDKTLKTASSIPVVSDFVAMGSGGANALTSAGLNPFGNSDQMKRDAHDNWTKTTLGMSDADVSQLPQEQQDRLRKLQMGLTVASPVMSALDIASLGETGAAIGGLKTAAVTGGKDALITAGKAEAKNLGRNAAIAGISAPVVSAPIENYVNNGNALDFNGYDPSNIPREAGTAALWSSLLPGGAKKPAAEDVNNARTAVMHQITSDAGETARLAEEAAGSQPRKIEVQQPRQINVGDESAPGTNIPVTNNTPQPQTKPIVEVSGDTPGVNQVKVPTPDEQAAARFAAQPKANPDQSVSGMITDPGKVVTKSDKADAQATIDDMLKTGKIDEGQHQDLSQQLNNIPAQDEPAPKGQKINVQEVKSIPVEDQTAVPTNLPETPGDTRVTATADPNASRTQAAASAPVPASPAQISEENKAILANPSQFNKRQVAAARNQLKLAKQYAKTQEATAEAMDRIQTASPAAQSGEGFVPTGEFAKGQNGNIIQQVNRPAEMAQAVQETANMSPQDVIKTARDNAAANGGGFNRRDIRNVAAMFEQKRVQRGTPEFNELKAILKEDGSNWGQTGALRNYTIRRTASPDELISRFESKIYSLAEDPSKIDSKLFDHVDAAETKFTETRDAAMAAYNKFTQEPTSANAKAYHAAQDAADAADKDAKMTEYKVASQALKGNKDVKQVRELEKMAQSADMYQMDAVDSSMLSGTGTFVRNAANAAVGGIEEKLFGKMGARIASRLPNARKNDVVVGGGTSTRGFGKSVGNIVDASKARASEAGWNPLEHIKNWATTGNQLGDSLIDTQVSNNVKDHYTQLLKSQGYKGSELDNRAGVMARQDPDNVTGQYQTAARVAAGLGSGITRNNKVETLVKNVISDALSGGNPNKVTETTAKLITRMTLGFPTAIGRSVAEGTKRFTLGAPTFIRAMATKDPQQRALLVKEAVKQAGTGGAVIAPMFYALGASGAITGAYPSDPEERARWEREGISENSVKIGDNYYQLPAYLGSWALPGLFYASLGRNGGDWGAAAADTAKVVPSLLPTDQLTNVTDVINGRTDPSKFFSQTAASAVRAATPAGALLNQLAKSFDPTQNDTNSGDAVQNFISKVMTGIPGVANTLPNKTDNAGNVLKNPDPLALALGASSTNQQAGVDETKQQNTQTNATIQQMSDNGAFSDPNIKAIITDDKLKKAYQDVLDGKQISPDNIKKLQDAMAKGVNASDDSSYLEKEQYDSNLTALEIKKQLMSQDPTTKPSDLKKMDEQIARGQVYKANNIPYDVIDQYKNTSLSDWRAMGDPTSDTYDPDTYNKLWVVDQLLAKGGGTYTKGDPTKQKFSAKPAGKGRGGSRSSTYSSDFGKLSAGAGAPSVQKYASIGQASGSVPIINTVRPNIVHKIGSSG